MPSVLIKIFTFVNAIRRSVFITQLARAMKEKTKASLEAKVL